MDFFNTIVRGFLGFPSRSHEDSRNKGVHDPFEGHDGWHDEGDDDDDEDEDLRYPENQPHFGFRVFSDPLEIHRFFEQQMDEMLKSFQMFGNGDMFDGSNFGGLPAITEPGLGKDEQNPRDQMLKIPDSGGPSWQTATSGNKRDVILDDEVNKSGIESLFQDNENLPKNKIVPRVRSFGSSVITRIVRRPDGTVEQHRTVRDSSGHEETTITKQAGDKSHTMTTKILPSGEKEVVEDFVNLEPDKLQDFNKHWQPSHRTPDAHLSPPVADPAFKSIFSKLFP